MTIEYKDSKRIITYPSVDAYWDFDGSDYVDLGNTILSGTGAFSSMAVIKVDSAGSGSRDIWSNYRSSATGGNQLYVLSTNKVSYYQGSGNTSHTAGTALTDDTWYNVIIVNDGSTSTIYINGTSDGATSQSASVSGSNMQIGGLDSSGTFDGGIADVAFWSRALTTAEITALQSDPNPSNLSSTSNLISYYNFEQTSGNLIDQVGSNNGTNNGATQTGTRNVAQAKPTDVQDNSILVEKDTARRYWATLAPTFEDDFTSDKSWAESGTQFTIDTSTNNRLDFALKRDGADHVVYKDLTSVSDTAWVLRMHLNFTGNTSEDSYNKSTWFGLSSSNGAFSATQDALGMTLTWGNDNSWQANNFNGADLNSPTNYVNFSTTFTPTSEYWVEFIRESATSFTIELFSDATYSTSIEKETVTTSSAVTGLQYITSKMRNSTSKTEIQNGYLDDIEFYNGVTTATPITTWTLGGFQPTDISSLAHWYDASDSSTITKDGSNRVSQWNDKKGSDNLVQATGGNQPLWTDADQNSKAVIDFVSSRYMANSASSVAQPNTYFVALTAPASSGSTLRPFTSGNQQVFTSGAANKWQLYAGSQPNFTEDIGTAFQIWEITFNGSSSSWKVNNVSKMSGANTGTGTAGALELGRGNGGNAASNKVGEFIRYDGTLTDAQKTSVYNYLKKKWGL